LTIFSKSVCIQAVNHIASADMRIREKAPVSYQPLPIKDAILKPNVLPFQIAHNAIFIIWQQSPPSEYQ
jgi:hypothetical protein